MTITPGTGYGFQPQAGTHVVVAVGGTAVVAVTGPCNGGYIVNPATSAGQGGGSAEELFVDPVAAPGSTDATANGTTTTLPATGGTYAVPPLGAGQFVYVNAATSGHKFTAVVW
jgi:hypothetical protein